MSLNEWKNQTRSNLTKDQKQEALKAIYGLNEGINMAKKAPQVSPADIQKMREVIAQQEPEKPREFDLNHPEITPGIIPPYNFQEFPKIMYHAERGHLTVENAIQQKQLETGGWSIKPIPIPAGPMQESVIDAAIDEETGKLRRGRPPKTEEGN